MKIAVSATGNDLNADVDPRFGRCQYFVVVDPDSGTFEAIPNESAMASGGAGIQAAQTVSGMGVSVIITGNVGPNAHQTLTSAGIKIMVGAGGTIKEALERFKNGELSEAGNANVGSHFGMGRGGGRGMGQEMGRGGGGGRGRRLL